MKTTKQIEKNLIDLIGQGTWNKYSHLSYGEMAARPELADYRNELLQAEKDWFAAEDKAVSDPEDDDQANSDDYQTIKRHFTSNPENGRFFSNDDNTADFWVGMADTDEKVLVNLSSYCWRLADDDDSSENWHDIVDDQASEPDQEVNIHGLIKDILLSVLNAYNDDGTLTDEYYNNIILRDLNQKEIDALKSF